MTTTHLVVQRSDYGQPLMVGWSGHMQASLARLILLKPVLKPSYLHQKLNWVFEMTDTPLGFYAEVVHDRSSS